MLLTWISGIAVGTRAVPRDRLDQLLQGTLVARLLALVQRGGHGLRKEVRVARRTGFRSGRRGHESSTRGLGAGGRQLRACDVVPVSGLRILP